MIRRNRWIRRSCLGLVLSAAVSGCAPSNTFAPPPPPEVTVRHPDVRDVTVYAAFPGRTEAVDTIEARTDTAHTAAT